MWYTKKITKAITTNTQAEYQYKLAIFFLVSSSLETLLNKAADKNKTPNNTVTMEKANKIQEKILNPLLDP